MEQNGGLQQSDTIINGKYNKNAFSIGMDR